MIDARGDDHASTREGAADRFTLPAPAAPSASPRYTRVARVLFVGCLLSLALFVLVYLQLWEQTTPARHWLPWVVLGTGLLITFHAVSDLLAVLGHAVRHEDLARTRMQELTANRDRTREVLARIRDAVVVTDPGGYVLEWNEAATRTIGTTAEQARGQHCSVALGIRSPSRPLDCRQGCALLRQSDEGDSSFGVEVLRDRGDGSPQPLLANVGVVREAGDVVEVVHSLRDITHLRQADEAKTMFLATTSHELRTPLAVIHGFAEMLAQRDLDPATRSNALDTILRRTQQLTSMVDALLQTSQMERHGVRLHPDLIDPTPVVTARLDDLRAASDREIRLTTDPGGLSCWADPQALGTVVEHLVENAVKYSPEGGPVEVHLSSSTEGSGVVLAVTDHGIGMDAEAVERSFDRFWQAEQGDDRRFAGTGVGLYLVRSLVEGMGGRVTVASQPGAGSTFEVALRAEPVTEVAERRPLVPIRRGSLVGDVLHHTGVGTPS